VFDAGVVTLVQEYWLSTMMLVIAGLLVLAVATKKVPAAGSQAPEVKA
jgi:hypothetical protein